MPSEPSPSQTEALGLLSPRIDLIDNPLRGGDVAGIYAKAKTGGEPGKVHYAQAFGDETVHEKTAIAAGSQDATPDNRLDQWNDDGGNMAIQGAMTDLSQKTEIPVAPPGREPPQPGGEEIPVPVAPPAPPPSEAQPPPQPPKGPEGPKRKLHEPYTTVSHKWPFYQDRSSSEGDLKIDSNAVLLEDVKQGKALQKEIAHIREIIDEVAKTVPELQRQQVIDPDGTKRLENDSEYTKRFAKMFENRARFIGDYEGTGDALFVAMREKLPRDIMQWTPYLQAARAMRYMELDKENQEIIKFNQQLEKGYGWSGMRVQVGLAGGFVDVSEMMPNYDEKGKREQMPYRDMMSGALVYEYLMDIPYEKRADGTTMTFREKLKQLTDKREQAGTVKEFKKLTDELRIYNARKEFFERVLEVMHKRAGEVNLFTEPEDFFQREAFDKIRELNDATKTPDLLGKLFDHYFSVHPEIPAKRRQELIDRYKKEFSQTSPGDRLPDFMIYAHKGIDWMERKMEIAKGRKKLHEVPSKISSEDFRQGGTYKEWGGHEKDREKVVLKPQPQKPEGTMPTAPPVEKEGEDGKDKLKGIEPAPTGKKDGEEPESQEREEKELSNVIQVNLASDRDVITHTSRNAINQGMQLRQEGTGDRRIGARVWDGAKNLASGFWQRGIASNLFREREERWMRTALGHTGMFDMPPEIQKLVIKKGGELRGGGDAAHKARRFVDKFLIDPSNNIVGFETSDRKQGERWLRETIAAIRAGTIKPEGMTDPDVQAVYAWMKSSMLDKNGFAQGLSLVQHGNETITELPNGALKDTLIQDFFKLSAGFINGTETEDQLLLKIDQYTEKELREKLQSIPDRRRYANRLTTVGANMFEIAAHLKKNKAQLIRQGVLQETTAGSGSVSEASLLQSYHSADPKKSLKVNVFLSDGEMYAGIRNETPADRILHEMRRRYERAPDFIQNDSLKSAYNFLTKLFNNSIFNEVTMASIAGYATASALNLIPNTQKVGALGLVGTAVGLATGAVAVPALAPVVLAGGIAAGAFAALREWDRLRGEMKSVEIDVSRNRQKSHEDKRGLVQKAFAFFYGNTTREEMEKVIAPQKSAAELLTGMVGSGLFVATAKGSDLHSNIPPGVTSEQIMKTIRYAAETKARIDLAYEENRRFVKYDLAIPGSVTEAQQKALLDGAYKEIRERLIRLKNEKPAVFASVLENATQSVDEFMRKIVDAYKINIRGDRRFAANFRGESKQITEAVQRISRLGTDTGLISQEQSLIARNSAASNLRSLRTLHRFAAVASIPAATTLVAHGLETAGITGHSRTALATGTETASFKNINLQLPQGYKYDAINSKFIFDRDPAFNIDVKPYIQADGSLNVSGLEAALKNIGIEGKFNNMSTFDTQTLNINGTSLTVSVPKGTHWQANGDGTFKLLDTSSQVIKGYEQIRPIMGPSSLIIENSAMSAQLILKLDSGGTFSSNGHDFWVKDGFLQIRAPGGQMITDTLAHKLIYQNGVIKYEGIAQNVVPDNVLNALKAAGVTTQERLAQNLSLEINEAVWKNVGDALSKTGRKVECPNFSNIGQKGGVVGVPASPVPDWHRWNSGEQGWGSRGIGWLMEVTKDRIDLTKMFKTGHGATIIDMNHVRLDDGRVVDVADLNIMKDHVEGALVSGRRVLWSENDGSVFVPPTGSNFVDDYVKAQAGDAEALRKFAVVWARARDPHAVGENLDPSYSVAIPQGAEKAFASVIHTGDGIPLKFSGYGAGERGLGEILNNVKLGVFEKTVVPSGMPQPSLIDQLLLTGKEMKIGAEPGAYTPLAPEYVEYTENAEVQEGKPIQVTQSGRRVPSSSTQSQRPSDLEAEKERAEHEARIARLKAPATDQELDELKKLREKIKKKESVDTHRLDELEAKEYQRFKQDHREEFEKEMKLLKDKKEKMEKAPEGQKKAAEKEYQKARESFEIRWGTTPENPDAEKALDWRFRDEQAEKQKTNAVAIQQKITRWKDQIAQAEAALAKPATDETKKGEKKSEVMKMYEETMNNFVQAIKDEKTSIKDIAGRLGITEEQAKELKKLPPEQIEKAIKDRVIKLIAIMAVGHTHKEELVKKTPELLKQIIDELEPSDKELLDKNEQVNKVSTGLNLLLSQEFTKATPGLDKLSQEEINKRFHEFMESEKGKELEKKFLSEILKQLSITEESYHQLVEVVMKSGDSLDRIEEIINRKLARAKEQFLTTQYAAEIKAEEERLRKEIEGAELKVSTGKDDKDKKDQVQPSAPPPAQPTIIEKAKKNTAARIAYFNYPGFHGEDSLRIAATKLIEPSPNFSAYIISADGHSLYGKGGAVASYYAVNRFPELYDFYSNETRRIKNKHDPVLALQWTIMQLDKEIIELIQKEVDKNDGGTTFTAGVRVDDTLYIAQLGDSRLYHYSDEKLNKVTPEHNFSDEKNNRYGIAVSRSLGDQSVRATMDKEDAENYNKPEIIPFKVKPGDIVLAGSDSLEKLAKIMGAGNQQEDEIKLNEFIIEQIKLYKDDVDKIADAIRKKALDSGVQDDISIAVYNVLMREKNN